MTNKTNVFSSAARKAMMELCILGEYGVSDRVGVCECIESLDDKSVHSLAKTILHLKNDQEIKQLLEATYVDSLKKKNDSIPVLSETAWANNRDSILMEADNSQTQSADNVINIFKKGGPIAAGVYMAGLYAKNPGEAARQMQNLRILGGYKAYEAVTNQVKRITGGRISFPELKKTNVALNKLQAQQQKIANAYKQGKTPSHQMNNAVEKAKEAVRKARKMDLIGTRDAAKKTLRYTGGTLLAMAGITAMAIAMYKLLQDLSMEAIKACRGKYGKERTACILTHKIQACDIALRKWRESLVACKDKPNPEKCIHSVQTQIWNLEKRKKRYQDKLAQIARTAAQPPPKPSTTPPEDTPSGDGGGVFRAKA